VGAYLISEDIAELIFSTNNLLKNISRIQQSRCNHKYIAKKLIYGKTLLPGYL